MGLQDTAPMRQATRPCRGPGGLLLLTACLWLSPAVAGQEAGNVFFETKVAPVLEKHCYRCHSHAGGKIRGGLALDSRSGWQKGGRSGPAIVPGQPDRS